MSKLNRSTLKNYFTDGARPGQAQFGDLIDSMLNMADEGFSKTAQDGFRVSTPVNHDALLSFYRDQTPRDAHWTVGYDGSAAGLRFARGPGLVTEAAPPVLLLDAAGNVGVGTAAPAQLLDVAGTVAMQGRSGQPVQPTEADPLLANGEWQNLTGELTACQGFEVMAGTGRVGEGRYALLHAIALNTFNPRDRWLGWLRPRSGIRSTHAWYGRRCDRLQLRWHGDSGKNARYRLQIRTGCDYGAGVLIQVQLTQLWSDAFMAGAAPAVPSAPA
ncbi:hypothetical protein [Derxia lacustris]|uniref:hypothetical protein n=1 Tax=Derxia lacustris TaxID=764842 RepID=UPI000A17239E|nr:hypothetical protein [Derxia lacustris]